MHLVSPHLYQLLSGQRHLKHLLLGVLFLQLVALMAQTDTTPHRQAHRALVAVRLGLILVFPANRVQASDRVYAVVRQDLGLAPFAHQKMAIPAPPESDSLTAVAAQAQLAALAPYRLLTALQVLLLLRSFTDESFNRSIRGVRLPVG